MNMAKESTNGTKIKIVPIICSVLLLTILHTIADNETATVLQSIKEDNRLRKIDDEKAQAEYKKGREIVRLREEKSRKYTEALKNYRLTTIKQRHLQEYYQLCAKYKLIILKQIAEEKIKDMTTGVLTSKEQYMKNHNSELVEYLESDAVKEKVKSKTVEIAIFSLNQKYRIDIEFAKKNM